jgi:ribosomal protein L40E
MSFMNDWRSKIAKATKTISQTSGDLYKTTKLNLTMGTEEENLKKLYLEVGKKVHEIYAYGGSLGKFFDEKYKEIKEVETKIDELKKQLEELRQTKICPACGKEADKVATFCPKCGASLEGVMIQVKKEPEIQVQLEEEQIESDPIIQKVVEEIVVQEEAKVTKKICPTCKAQNHVEDRFCISCGRAIF